MHKWKKWIGRILLGILLLLVLLVLVIHTAPVRNFIRGKLESYLSKKTNSEIHIAGLNYRLPKWVELDGVFFRDKAGDTLLYGNKVRVDIAMLKLLKGEYQVSRIELGDVNVNIYRKANDTSFNFQYLVDAFSSKTPSAEPEKKSPLSVSLDEMEITRTRFRWNDDYGGTSLVTSIGSFKVNLNALDLNKQKYDISKCNVADMRFDMHLYNTGHKKEVVAVSDSAKASILPSIEIAKLNIERSHFAFNGEEAGINTVNDIGLLALNKLSIAAPQKILLDKLELDNSSVSLDRNVIEKAVEKIRQVDTTTSDLAVSVKQVKLFNNTLAYNSLSQKRQVRGFDAGHVKLTALSAGITDIGYGDNTIKLKVDSMSAREQSGFVLDSLHGDINMKDTVILAKNILIKTPYSRIAGDATIYPQSIDAKYAGVQQNDVRFIGNTIGKKDIALLAPSVMDKYYRQLQGVSYLYITADVKGNAHKAILRTVAFHSDRNDLNVNANGTLYNAMNTDALVYDLSIPHATAARSFIDPFVNTKGRKTVDLPPSISLSGKLNGTMRQVTTNLTITSAYGTAILRGSLRNFTNPDKLGYDMRLLAKDLETGRWIGKDSMLGKLNGSVIVKGSGTDYKKLNMNSILDISSFRMDKHIYTGIKFGILANAGNYDVKGGVTDSLLHFNMNVRANVAKQYPDAVGKVNIMNADLFALGFYKEPFRFRSMMDIQARDLSPNTLDAALRMDSTVIYQDRKAIRVDSLIARGKIDSGKTMITLYSPFADLAVKGDYKYNELPGVLQAYVARYTKKGTVSPQTAAVNLTMDMDLKPDPIYAILLPGLFFDKNIHATGRIDTKQKDSSLYFYLTAPRVVYNSDRVANLQATMNGIGDSIRYSIVMDTVRASSLQLFATSITGGFSNGHASANFETLDPRRRRKYALGVFAAINNDSYQLHLGDTLTLNYANWNVDKSNLITYSPQGINVHQFAISRGNENVSVNSSGAAPNAPIDVKIDQFALQNITGLLDRDSLEIGGRLNAQVKVDGLGKPVPLFNGTVKIDTLTYQQELVGNIEVQAQNSSADAVSFSGKLTGNRNNVDLKGTYNQSNIDAQVNLNPIEMKSIEPFTQHNLTRSSGVITGNINVTGKVSSPEWNGTIRFDSVKTSLAQFGTVLNLQGQQIDLKYPTITFNQFTIRDSLNHNLVVNGTVQQENGGFNTNLTVKTKNFTALDNNPVANNTIYGKAVVDVDVTINGPAATPDITGNIGLKANSDVTFVRQERIASAKDRQGVIEFIDMDTIKNYMFTPADTVIAHKPVQVAMLNYNLNIDINKDAKFAVIIDPITRDELQVQGAGQINAAVAPNGDVLLTGAYNLSKGSYQLNNKFIKRKFELQEGSTIVLSGDPSNAEANITAVYDIEASPYDLLATEIADNNNTNVYKQKLPFQVLLKIKGRVMEPELSFDIQLKKDVSGINYDMQTTIDNKFQQMRADASVMNKQVFALLVMGRFIGEQSQDFFAGSSGNGLKADEVVKESVSRFLSDAVSQVAADLIKGVDVDVNLKTVDNYTDATQRTDLNLALSKRFLNDRLSITVGKSFTVDGEDPLAKGQDNSNVQFLPDITTTYKLSKDGRYMLKAYQKSEYEAILDGYFIETGVAFTLSMDYNKFKQLFRKSKLDKQLEKEQKKESKARDEKNKAKDAEIKDNSVPPTKSQD